MVQNKDLSKIESISRIKSISRSTTVDISGIASDMLTDIERIENFFINRRDGINTEAFYLWAIQNKICPAAAGLVYRIKKPYTLKAYSEFEQIVFAYLDNELAIKYLTERIGCPLDSATDQQKIDSLSGIDEKTRDFNIENNSSLETMKTHGITKVTFVCQQSLGCHQHNQKNMDISDAMQFDNECMLYCSKGNECNHKWVKAFYEDKHTYTLHEMCMAFNPSASEIYYQTDRRLASLKSMENNSKELEQLISMVSHIFNMYLNNGMYMEKPEKALLYRILGEMYLEKGDKGMALVNFKKALEQNPRVGVKRVTSKLEKELTLKV